MNDIETLSLYFVNPKGEIIDHSASHNELSTVPSKLVDARHQMGIGGQVCFKYEHGQETEIWW